MAPPRSAQPYPPALLIGVFALVAVGLGLLGLGLVAVLRMNATPPPRPSPTAAAVAGLPSQVVVIPTTTPEPTATETASPTATPSAAPPSPSPSPTEAQAAAASATATAAQDVVTSITSSNVRAGPGTQYPSIGGLQLGESAPVLGRDSSGTWFAIDYGLATEGNAWIAAVVVDYAGSINALPIVAAPPPPPPTATPRPAANPAPGPVSGTHGVCGQLTMCGGRLAFAVMERVCFVEWIRNNTAEPVSYGLLGVLAVNTGSGATQFQTSWSAQGVADGRLWIDPGCVGPTDRCNGQWEDGMRLASPGSWRLTMQLCFSAYSVCLEGGEWESLSAPIVITVN